MLKTVTYRFICKTAKNTVGLAKQIGNALRGGEVIEFQSDLGGGKTTFVKGLAAGMGVKDIIQSPTFTISMVHKASRGMELHHFDFYRLSDLGIMSAELAESLHQDNVVVAIEWGQIVHAILPKDKITVSLSTPNLDETRLVDVSVPKNHGYLVRALNRYKAEIS